MDARETAQTLRVIAVILIFAGILMVGYGAYAYATERHEVDVELREVDVEPSEGPVVDDEEIRGLALYFARVRLAPEAINDLTPAAP